MSLCHEIADEDCHWHSIGLGLMRVQKVAAAPLYVVYRLSTAGDVFCGMFADEGDAMRITRVLSTLPDEAFQ